MLDVHLAKEHLRALVEPPREWGVMGAIAPQPEQARGEIATLAAAVAL